MTFDEIPYFMTNEDWFYDDLEEGILKLTDKAPLKARQSYKDFYDKLNMVITTVNDTHNSTLGRSTQ